MPPRGSFSAVALLLLAAVRDPASGHRTRRAQAGAADHPHKCASSHLLCLHFVHDHHVVGDAARHVGACHTLGCRTPGVSGQSGDHDASAPSSPQANNKCHALLQRMNAARAEGWEGHDCRRFGAEGSPRAAAATRAPPGPFIVITEQRSGSTSFMDYLGTTWTGREEDPGAAGTDALAGGRAAPAEKVFAEQEYLNRQYFNGKNKQAMYRLKARMQSLWHRHNGSAVGFKWMWKQGLVAQLDEVRAYLNDSRPAIRLIFLIRTDCVGQYISLQQLYLGQAPVHVVDGEGTFVYDEKKNPEKNALSKTKYKEKKLYTFDTEKAKEHCRTRARTWGRLLETLPKGLVVLYSNHTYHALGEPPEANAWDRVADYLGLARREHMVSHQSIVHNKPWWDYLEHPDDAKAVDWRQFDVDVLADLAQ